MSSSGAAPAGLCQHPNHGPAGDPGPGGLETRFATLAQQPARGGTGRGFLLDVALPRARCGGVSNSLQGQSPLQPNRVASPLHQRSFLRLQSVTAAGARGLQR